MSNIVNLDIRRVGAYLNITLDTLDITQDLGLFDEAELVELANKLEEAVNEIHSYIFIGKELR